MYTRMYIRSCHIVEVLRCPFWSLLLGRLFNTRRSDTLLPRVAAGQGQGPRVRAGMSLEGRVRAQMLGPQVRAGPKLEARP